MKQIRSCDNCREANQDNTFYDPCWDCEDLSEWKSKRGRKKGSKPKPGSKKPGAHKLPVGEKKQHLNLHVKGKTIDAWGGMKAAQTEAENHLETKSK